MLKIINEIVTKDKLSENHIENLNTLLTLSNKEDNLTLDFSSDNFEDDIIKILVYEENTLISYIAITNPSISGHSYCWGTIHPRFRNADFYSNLFAIIKDNCIENNISSLKIVNEQNAGDFKNFIISSGGIYLCSTYKMKFHKKYYNFTPCKTSNLSLNRASIKDLNDIIPIGMEAFQTSEDDERDYNETNLRDSKCINFIGRINDIVVGIISTRIENNEGSIADLGVLKSYRRQGIGGSILSQTIDFLLTQGIENFSLSVETENKNALSLYEDCGFRVFTINDCYDIKL